MVGSNQERNTGCFEPKLSFNYELATRHPKPILVMTSSLNRTYQHAACTPLVDSILITGVSPFEDLPGYQYHSLLLKDRRYRVALADDSDAALTILRTTGASIDHLAHPGIDRQEFVRGVAAIAKRLGARVIVPGTDAHLFALAEACQSDDWLRERCPSAVWLADKGIKNKCHLQEWISRFLRIPKYKRSSIADLDANMESFVQLPVMVKGLHKGAGICLVSDDLAPTARAILRNPANQNSDGHVYLEERIAGEEHSLLILCTGDGVPWSIGLRKLATTQSGTTLAAVVEYDALEWSIVETIAQELTPGMAIELEWRGTGHDMRVFEVNCRFPSWIGALGEFGHSLLAASIEMMLDRTPGPLCARPDPGSVIYRLPQSGFLSPEVAFNSSLRARPLLWQTASPHQFLVK